MIGDNFTVNESVCVCWRTAEVLNEMNILGYHESVLQLTEALLCKIFATNEQTVITSILDRNYATIDRKKNRFEID